MYLGISLEGGGMRCMAQVGLLLELEAAGIVPDMYTGCGTGALVAAMAASHTLSEAAAMEFSKSAHGNARLRAMSIESRLRTHFGGHAMREAEPLALPSLDMETGNQQVLSSILPARPDPRPWSRQALITTAVRASMSPPGLMPPTTWRTRRLIGGGQLRDALPGLLLAMGATRILTVRVLDVGCVQAETDPQALSICAHAIEAPLPPHTDMLIVIGGYENGSGVLCRKNAQAYLEAGQLAARKALPQIQRMLGREKGKIVAFPGLKSDD